MIRTLVCFAAIATRLAISSIPGHAAHVCDPLGDPGWLTVPTQEIVGVKDAAPVRDGDDWFIERTTTILPLCNYINAAGNYSLRSYSLSPEDSIERVAICKGTAAVAPYVGPCPPR